MFSLRHGLQDIRVSSKLYVGFGVVLLLAALIAITGGTGMRSAHQSIDKTKAAATFRNIVSDLSVARLEYMREFDTAVQVIVTSKATTRAHVTDASVICSCHTSSKT